MDLIICFDFKSPSAHMDIRRHVNFRGLTIRDAQKIWDSSLAGIGCDWAKQQGPETTYLVCWKLQGVEGNWTRDVVAL